MSASGTSFVEPQIASKAFRTQAQRYAIENKMVVGGLVFLLTQSERVGGNVWEKKSASSEHESVRQAAEFAH